MSDREELGGVEEVGHLQEPLAHTRLKVEELRFAVAQVGADRGFANAIAQAHRAGVE